MPHLEFSARRFILAGGFALAVAATPAVAAFAVPSTAPTFGAACPSGEEEDLFTTVCIPHTVPNSPSGFTTTEANPDIPEIDGVPCTGRDSGACIGLGGGPAGIRSAPRIHHRFQPDDHRIHQLVVDGGPAARRVA